jgi:hypothetical protein
MNKFVVTALTAGGLAGAALIGAHPASAAPWGSPSAQETVNQLQSQGHRVILNKVGSAALGDCTISSVRPGETINRLDTTATTSPTVPSTQPST